MARSSTDSLNLLETTLSDITTSLRNKEVVVDSLKASEVPNKIREIETTKIFGVKIFESMSYPSSRVSYIDSATSKSPVSVSSSTGKATYNGWDETWIFEKIYPVMLKYNGTIDYKLDPNDYSKKLGGGNSDVANINYNGNAMVCVEKFYTKFSMDGENEVIEICDKKKDGFEAIGFIREDGSEADRIFLPMYMGFIDTNGRLRSISGQEFTVQTTFNDFRTAAQKNGSGYDIESYAMNQMMQAVYLILMKNCDSRSAIGIGRTPGGSTITGLGNGNTLGAISSSTASGYSYPPIKFMHIEDFSTSTLNEMNYYGYERFETGLLRNDSQLYVRMKPPYSDDTSISGYSQITDALLIMDGNSHYISKMKCSNSTGRYTIECNGAKNYYEAATMGASSSNATAISSRCSHRAIAGRNLFYSNKKSNGRLFGAALSYLPPA